MGNKKCGCFKVGDKVVTNSNGGKMIGKVLSISGPLMTVDVTTPRIGRMSNIPVGGWSLVQSDKKRCSEPPRIGGENDRKT